MSVQPNVNETAVAVAAPVLRRRLIVVPIIRRDDGRYLLCRMPAHRGVFPGQWGLPGGGVEDDERIEDALRREVREELQLELESMRPAFFKGEEREKLYPDGRRETLYMVFLIYLCTANGIDPVINEELDAFAWVAPDELSSYDLNVATRATLREVGILRGAPERHCHSEPSGEESSSSR